MGAKLEGRRALAVGCGQGFGAVTAQLLAAEGARVMIADIDADRAEEAARASRDGGFDAVSHWVDIGDEGAVRVLVDATVDRFGGLDIVFNNAAALGTPDVYEDAVRPVLNISTEAWDVTMRVNLRGPWLVCKHAIPHMIRGGGGSIINTASLAATATMAVSGAYSVSKGGVNTLSAVIATQYGRSGIRCNAVNPGMIETRHLPAEYGAVIVRHNLVPRLGTGDDIAKLVLFLASDDSGYITGQCLTVDGGFAVHGPTWAEMSGADAPRPVSAE
jgi:NAD(P)-dependent dehydrogenase (short-subunit alcohol dehydrogenase family)